MIRNMALAILTAGFTLSFQASASEPAAQANLENGKALASTICAACHGADGNSMISANPHLAGQVPQYLEKQLNQFKSGQRANPIMMGMAATLNEQGVKDVSAWFASQPLSKAAVAQDTKLAAEGKKIWRGGIIEKGVPACAGCHGATGSGLPAQYPRLSGQFADYTAAQLKLFRTGERANDPEKMMQMIAAKLSDKEIQAVSEYAAGLR